MLRCRLERSFVEIQQEPGEEIIQDQDQDDGIDHGLGDGAADAARAADGGQALVAGDGADDDGEDEAFEQAVQDVAEFDDIAQVGEEAIES